MKRISKLKSTLLGVAALTFVGGASVAQEVTLRLHQFLPPPAPVPKLILKPWAQSVEEASGGRIKIEHFDAMSLGGRPPELLGQARDGVVDISMTVAGYTPGLFPRTEVFELPFMMTNPVATAAAYWEKVDTDWVSK
jgi:TRAP-type C4-dicarboxylate transport system substrate-binding protein